MSEEVEKVVPVPADVVSGVIAFLKNAGFNTVSKIPLDPTPGLIRVSRVGGEPLNLVQDHAEILIEVWEDSQPASFDLAIRAWAHFAAISGADQDAFPGIVLYEATPTTPIQYPDPYLPLMDRHQFTVTVISRMTTITI